MRFLYGKFFHDRYSVLAGMIPERSSVLEVCSGDCWLYLKYLRKKNIIYQGSDVNEVFLSHAQKKNIPILKLDLLKDILPRAEFVVMQASLYQFIPRQKYVVDKLLASATKKVLIAEPIKNLATSSNPIISFLAKRLANPGDGQKFNRFDESSLDQLMNDHYSNLIDQVAVIPGGREKIYSLDATMTDS